MPPLARAYLITFRTYGTWLPGEGRHSMDRRRVNAYRGPVIGPSPRLRESSRTWMEGEAVVLDQESRAVVNAAVAGVCVHRGWFLLAVNARPNHVHVVLSAAGGPEEAMATLKAWSTRRLREAGHVAADARVWARHGSTRYL